MGGEGGAGARKRRRRSPGPPDHTARAMRARRSSNTAAPLAAAAALVCLFKVLLWRAPYSTDFGVHWHWKRQLAVQPLRQWYTEGTGAPFLDYPPWFGYWEAAWGRVARTLRIEWRPGGALTAAPAAVVAFQRATVLLGDSALLWGTWRLLQQSQFDDPPRLAWHAVSVWAHPGLLLVDHVHFQYNGMVIGVLLAALADWGALWQRRRSRDRKRPRGRATAGRAGRAAMLYAAAVCLKHTTALGVAPAVAAMALSVGAWRQPEVWLGGGAVLASALLPFWVSGRAAGMPARSFWAALLHRLVPLGERGLLHAYWAPNAYALLAAADKLLAALLRLAARRCPTGPTCTALQAWWMRAPLARNTAGLVETGGGGFRLLPPVTPRLSLLLTLCSTAPAASALLRRPPPASTARRTRDRLWLLAVAQCSLGYFLFGWHMHEKALLLPSILTSLACGADHPVSVLLNAACIYAMFPLIGEPSMRLLRTVLLLTYVLWVWPAAAPPPPPSSRQRLRLRLLLRLYVAVGLPLLELTQSAVPWSRLGLPFAPLLLTSTYTALAVLYAWVHLTHRLWCAAAAAAAIPT
ncbi:hypothetical protein CDCA_CDCA05G1585 [Cyanidium caldarium]|uniref:Alpha-1,3-glucosyltransferase n=1 Tax=Cyanidium caldarium TaxID=2771 RepID=A0AAV9ITX2_CYACA|nr:hypothetical protein CDCA_CDCA05G1585 [Cyanidium caldarium]